MKFNWNKKYTTIAAYVMIVLLIVVSFYLGITKFSKLSENASSFMGIMKPFIIGLCMAYVFNFVLVFYEKKLVDKAFKNKVGTKVNRAAALVLTYLSVVILCALFFKFVLPQITESILGLISDMPGILNKSSQYIDKFINNIDMPSSTRLVINQKIGDFGRKAVEFGTNIAPLIANGVFLFVKGIWNTVLGIIVSIYILADKENFFLSSRKFVRAVFRKETGDKILYITRLSNDIFGKFLIGKIIDSCIIAFITFVVLSITKMPYKILLTSIIGVTNIIPFFGPFIGAIPSVLIVLLVDPYKAFLLLIIIFIIQQLDGNVIGPKILGDSIGISAFWILFSLLIAGKFMGIAGLVLGVPIFSVIYTLVTEFINNRLISKGLPIDKREYMDD